MPQHAEVLRQSLQCVGSLLFLSSHMAAAIARFISLEGCMVRLLRTRSWLRTLISMLRVEVVIHASVKICRSMKPLTGSDEVPANEPLRPIVAVRCAIIRGIVVVAKGAGRLGSEIDIDRNLSTGFRRRRKKKCCRRCRCRCKKAVSDTAHSSPQATGTHGLPEEFHVSQQN